MKTLISLIYLCLIVIGSVQAQRVYIVNSTQDIEDNAPGDGLCEAGPASLCTLRSAIKEANFSANLAAGPDEIHFSGIEGSSALITISLGSLPTITEPVLIDGFTGPVNRVSIDVNDPSRDGLVLWIGSDHSEIRGMIIGNGRNAIRVNSGNNLVFDNFLGTAPNGLDVGNEVGIMIEMDNNTITHNVIGFNETGIWDEGAGNAIMSNFIGVSRNGQNRANTSGVRTEGENGQIGGPHPENGNLFGYNTSTSIYMSGPDNLIQHNFIGTNAAGDNLGSAGPAMYIGDEGAMIISNTVGFSRDGVFLAAEEALIQKNYLGVNAAGHNVGNTLGIFVVDTEHSIIGGSVDDANFIGFNGTGISLDNTEFTTVQGNFIGTNGSGDNWGNTGGGLVIDIATVDNIIGYDVTDVISSDLLYANTIAHNGGNGIMQYDGPVPTPGRNVFRGNIVYENNGLGIDLGNDGPTSNDIGDADAGTNDFQNYPDVSQAGYNGGRDMIVIEYTVSSDDTIVNYPLTVDVYLADDNASGEGKTHIGSDIYASPNQHGRVEIPAAGLTWESNDVVVLTATDADGNTSEFSPASQQLGGGSSAMIAGRDSLVSASAQRIFVVNTLADHPDAIPGDGVCKTLLGKCTFRAAIEEANASPNLPAGPDKLVLSTSINLPAQVVATDTYGVVEHILIDFPVDFALNGQNNAVQTGLHLKAGSGGSTIRGLSLGNFGVQAILIESDGNRLTSMQIGASASCEDYGNGMGVYVNSDNNIIGPDNLIGHNASVGVLITGSHNRITSNYLGTNEAGKNCSNANGDLQDNGSHTVISGNQYGTGGSQNQSLSAPYPNPFNPQTTFTLLLPEAGDTRITVYDMLGRQVALLHEGELAAGITHAFTFDASSLSSGTYLLRVDGAHFVETRRLVLLK